MCSSQASVPAPRHGLTCSSRYVPIRNSRICRGSRWNRAEGQGRPWLHPRVLAVDALMLPRAVAAGTSVAGACGLRVDDAVVVSDSNRLAVHLQPCDVLARVAPRVPRPERAVERVGHLSAPGAP